MLVLMDEEEGTEEIGEGGGGWTSAVVSIICVWRSVCVCMWVAMVMMSKRKRMMMMVM